MIVLASVDRCVLRFSFLIGMVVMCALLCGFVALVVLLVVSWMALEMIFSIIAS